MNESACCSRSPAPVDDRWRSGPGVNTGRPSGHARRLLYQQVADILRKRICQGIYPAGSRLPGLRALAEQMSVSLSTVVTAVRLLEDDALLEGRERSGYYVLEDGCSAPSETGTDERGPALIASQSMTLNLLKASAAVRFGRLGVAMPDPSFLPVRPLQQAFRQAKRWRKGPPVDYTFPPGLEVLRQQISRRLARGGCEAAPERIVVTSGAQEAISLSLKTITVPGDIIAVESPTYYGLLQAAESLGLKVLEIPTDARNGISLPALRLALEQWPVKACVLVPNHGNPTGHAMSGEAKQALAALLDATGAYLVEDDVYGELGYREGRPRTVQSYMQRDNWFLAGSASKIISAGLRLGWLVAPPHIQQQVEYLQYTRNGGASTLDQLALAEYLARGGLDRHLRRVRKAYQVSTDRMAELVLSRFPAGTSVTTPAGGYLLWITAPPCVSSDMLHRRALARGIAVAPGSLFSASSRVCSAFRLNAAVVWNEALESALSTLAKLTDELCR